MLCDRNLRFLFMMNIHEYIMNILWICFLTIFFFFFECFAGFVPYICFQTTENDWFWFLNLGGYNNAIKWLFETASCYSFSRCEFFYFFSFSVGVIFFYFSGKSTSIRTDFFLNEDWRNPLDKSFIQLLAFFQETLLSFCWKGTELVQ